jgi:Protein of unknown function (DUF2505)
MASFAAKHEFDAPPGVVAAAMTDPAFVSSLRLPDLEAPEVLGRGADGGGASLRYRYRFVGSLDPIARRILGNDRISWVQEVRVDDASEHGTLTVTADAHPDKLQFSGDYRLEPTADGGTVRSLNGTLSIRVPVIGRRAENHILPGLLRRIDLEADALRDWLGARA